MLSQAYPPTSQSLARSSSQPNLLMRSSSILGRRRSASPLDDKQDYGSSNKRRAVSVTGKEGDEEASEPSAAEAAAAAVVAAAAAASGSISPSEKTSMGGLQIIGVDYTNKSGPTKGLGLLMDTATPTYVLSGADTSSPSIEALGVARASSYAAIEDQKDMGIDYSLFTRVETAGWRILIPPNVTASFQSDDFGLVLKPKGPPSDVTLGGASEEDTQGGSRRSSDGGQSVEDPASDEIKKSFSNIALNDHKESEKEEDLEMEEKAKGNAVSDEKEEEKEPVQEDHGEDVDMDELEDE